MDQEKIFGPSSVDRTETMIEMGVAYAPGVPSPMEGATTTFEPIVVDGLVVKTGGGAGRNGGGHGAGLGCPVQYIKLSAWCAPAAFSMPVDPSHAPPPAHVALPLCTSSVLCPHPHRHCRDVTGRDPTPVECNYTGLRFVSKQALAAAKSGK